MKPGDLPNRHNEIIIVKRGGNDDEDGHHGGVWKIAFADFMTAMMCFFLVMWLVSATNEETKAAVASYFNPMAMMEPEPAGSGIDDPGVAPRSREDSASQEMQRSEVAPDASHAVSGPGDHAHSVDHADQRQTSDQHLFADPYAVLAEIVAETGTLQNVSVEGDGGAQMSGPATGATGGESYRDPFAPDFWSSQLDDDEKLEEFTEAESTSDRDDAGAGLVALAIEDTDEETASGGQIDPVEMMAAVKSGTDQLLPEEPEPAELSAAESAADEIRRQLGAAFGEGDALNQAISVEALDDGVLISVTDELNYGMFEIGSAVPQRQLVLAMEQISETIGAQPGNILINGHTDARPFRGETYDNWRLSTARAHSAYYMLVRAGTDENRIKAVTGYADRRLKNADDPNADVNRRIEIILEMDG